MCDDINNKLTELELTDEFLSELKKKRDIARAEGNSVAERLLDVLLKSSSTYRDSFKQDIIKTPIKHFWIDALEVECPKCHETNRDLDQLLPDDSAESASIHCVFCGHHFTIGWTAEIEIRDSNMGIKGPVS